METADLPLERLNRLSNEAVSKVFLSMVGEELTLESWSSLARTDEADLFSRLPLEGGSVFTIVVGFVGDAHGNVMLTLPQATAEAFTLTLFDAPSLDWIGEDAAEAMIDTMGELGNMLAGLVKGGLTKWFPQLMLTTPRVLRGKRLRIDNAAVAFRLQYLFEGFSSKILLDLSCQ